MANTQQRRPRTADGEEVHQMLVRLPKSLHGRLRERAFRDDRPKAEVIRDALTLYLDAK
jgi:predicted DNA-binding protein